MKVSGEHTSDSIVGTSEYNSAFHDQFDIGTAMRLIKRGFWVGRTCWYNKYLELQKKQESVMCVYENNSNGSLQIDCRPIHMHWCPTSNELLATDYQIVWRDK